VVLDWRLLRPIGYDYKPDYRAYRHQCSIQAGCDGRACRLNCLTAAQQGTEQQMAIGSITPFRPTETVSLSIGVASATVQLAGGGDSVVVTNPSASLAYVRFGADPSVSASGVDMPVMANSRMMLSVNGLIGYAAAILSSGSGTILFTRGDGSFL
jgi:hypothetical protein